MTHTINAYHGDPDFKAHCVARAQEHADADRLQTGCYVHTGEHWTGCSVGCDYYDIEGRDGNDYHATTAAHFGFPEWLEHLRDEIFEGLSEAERNGWHVRLKKAVPVGLDEARFERVRHQLAVRTLTRLRDRQREATPDDPWGVIAALDQTITYHSEAVKGQYFTRAAAESAWSAARSAEAWSAAWSAESAAESARSAARSAEAWSAAWSAARSAARSAAWSEQAAEVLELLENA